jgi:hypothetical protein
MTLTLMKCNLTMALLWCVRDCSDWIEMNSTQEEPDVSPIVSLKAMECIATCLECLEAFESSKTSVRGLLTRAVSHACESFLTECEFRGNPNLRKCMDSCQRCIEECENLLAIDSFSSFFNHLDSPAMVN